MDPVKRNILLFNSASIGFINDSNNYKGLLSDRVKNMHEEAKKLLERSSELLGVMDGECEKLVEEIKAGNIKFDTIRKVDEIEMQKKLGKRQMIITVDDRDNIAMHALNFTCKECTRNKKRCSLRTSLQNAGVEPYHDETTKCPYDMK